MWVWAAGRQAGTMRTPTMGICTGRFPGGGEGRAVLPRGTPPRWQLGSWHYTSGAFELAGKPLQTSVPKEQLHRHPQLRIAQASTPLYLRPSLRLGRGSCRCGGRCFQPMQAPASMVGVQRIDITADALRTPKLTAPLPPCPHRYRQERTSTMPGLEGAGAGKAPMARTMMVSDQGGRSGSCRLARPPYVPDMDATCDASQRAIHCTVHHACAHAYGRVCGGAPSHCLPPPTTRDCPLKACSCQLAYLPFSPPPATPAQAPHSIAQSLETPSPPLTACPFTAQPPDSLPPLQNHLPAPALPIP